MKKVAMILGMILVAAQVTAPTLRVTTADLESESPTVAWSGSRAAVAWMDGRDGNMEIYFRMADPIAGTLGPEQRLTTAWTFDDNPRLCWTGSEFALSFIHEGKLKFDLMFMRFSPEGRPLGPALALVRQELMGRDTAVAWTGAGFGLLATEFLTGPAQGDLTFRFLDPAGKPQGAAATLVSGPGIKMPSALIRVGSDFAAFYLDAVSLNVYLLRIDPLGNRKDQPFQLNLPGTQADFPAAASNGKVMVAAWPQKAQTGRHVMVQVLSPDGKRLADPIPVTAPGPDRPALALAAGPDGFGLAYIELTASTKTLYFVKLDAGGKVIGEPAALSPPRASMIMSQRLAMTADAKGYLIAWPDLQGPTNSEILLTRVGY